MKNLIIIFLILISNTSFGQADTTTVIYKPNWVYATTSKDGDIIRIRSEYLSKNGDKIKLWVKDEMKSYTYKNKVYKNVECKSLWTVDCSNSKYLIEDMIYYTSNGDIIKSSPPSIYDQWVNVIPDSVSDGITKMVCEMFK